MTEMGALLERRRMDEAEVRRRMYRAPTTRERERWHSVWLPAQGWTAGLLHCTCSGRKPVFRRPYGHPPSGMP